MDEVSIEVWRQRSAWIDKELEAEIGKMVYDLYGMTDEEIRLIEG